MSFVLLHHAILMVWDNRIAALRIAAPLIVLLVLSNYILFALLPASFDPPNTTDPAAPLFAGPDWTYYSTNAVLTLVQFLLSSWVVVRWHRYVLLPDAQHAPPPPIGRVLAYFGNVILITLVYAGCALAFSAVLGLFGSALGSVVTILAFPLIVVGYLIMIRMSLALPACAIGEPIGINGAITASAGQTMMLLGLMLWALLLGVLRTLPSLGLLLGVPLTLPSFLLVYVLPPILWPLVNAMFGAVYAIVGASVLTTLYGVIIQKRDLRGS